ncbi:unnamed protein product [Darwinula stevensoni]|uniref:G domain-containing protein n=1 Tax=Darwinula stevensoni TaxID=69355 RepID=A0A7R8XBN5_9CRUS|nr:unnamed protein product [Darwinula stevensoni]CAG0892976.1 unnamed protein product [Darwinula stevensoni]
MRGKSMLLEVLGNYGLGVGFRDPYRFQVKKEGPTDEISSYTFFTRDRQRFPLPVTFIDTPGFLKGKPEEDQKLMDAISDFIWLHHKQGVNAVIFVVPSAQARLTAEQEMVLRNFTKVLEKEQTCETCYLFCTFADSRRLPVLQSVKEAGLKFKDHFPVNCSVYFVKENENKEDDSFDDEEMKGETETASLNELLWKMTMESIQNFIKDILRNHPVSAQERLDLAEGEEHGRKKEDTGTGTRARDSGNPTISAISSIDKDKEDRSLQNPTIAESHNPTRVIPPQSNRERDTEQDEAPSPSQSICNETNETKSKRPRKVWTFFSNLCLCVKHDRRKKEKKSGGGTASAGGFRDREVHVNSADMPGETDVPGGLPYSATRQRKKDETQYKDPKERKPHSKKSSATNMASTRPTKA